MPELSQNGMISLQTLTTVRQNSICAPTKWAFMSDGSERKLGTLRKWRTLLQSDTLNEQWFKTIDTLVIENTKNDNMLKASCSNADRDTLHDSKSTYGLEESHGISHKHSSRDFCTWQHSSVPIRFLSSQQPHNFCQLEVVLDCLFLTRIGHLVALWETAYDLVHHHHSATYEGENEILSESLIYS